MRLLALGLTFALALAVSAQEPVKPKPNPWLTTGAEPLAKAKDKADPNPKEAPKVRLAGPAGVGRLVPDVAFTDLAGKAGKLSDFKASKLTVVAFTNTTCPICKKYAPSLQRLEKEWGAKGVAFLLVNPTKTDKPADHGFAGRYVHDTEGTLTATLGATSTAEVFVLDAARTVQYRGAIDDQYGLGYSLDKPRANYLVVALGDLLGGKIPVIQATTAPGCELVAKPQAAAVDVTYHARIERIMQANCVDCHRKGGVAPFALDTYDDVIANKAMIKKTVDKGTMPPWFAAPPKKGEHSAFANDRTLTDSDKKDLFAWLASDMKKGDPADAPLPRNYASGWGLGKPDAVFQLPKPIAIKAEGVMNYQNVVVPTNFDEDKWVMGLEVQPTAREVVHHVLVFAVPKGSRGVGGEAQGFFAAYVPGSTALVYPEGYAKKLPKGYDLRFQIHYTPNGKATTDQTKLGLVFAKDKPRYEVRVSAAVNPTFSIPPGADNHKVTGSIPFIPWDCRILAFFPHAHVRGKAAQYELKTPDGKTTKLLDVPHYDFNWQLQYRFAEPVTVPRGSGLIYTAWYDNSDKNPANPDPKKTVKWGQQTYEEMHLGYVEFVIDSAKASEPVVGPKGEFKFPKDGVLIPAQFKDAFKRFDADSNGVIDQKEFDALPPAVRTIVIEYVKRTAP